MKVVFYKDNFQSRFIFLIEYKVYRLVESAVNLQRLSSSLRVGRNTVGLCIQLAVLQYCRLLSPYPLDQA